MNKSKLFLLSVFSIFTFFLASLTLAGGGGVETRITNTDDPHANTVIVYFDPKLFTCKGMHVSFNFESPENGDMIEGTNGNNTSTITEEAWMSKTRLRCSTYAKVYSKELKWNRALDISFKGANLEGSRQIAVSFGVNYNPNDLPLMSWESPDPSGIPTPPAQSLATPSVTPNVIVVPGPTKVEQPKVIVENNNEALSQKIASLEAQLEQSKKQHSILEQRINALVIFIKNLFPFFN